MEQYEIVRELGSGAFGQVLQCRHVDSKSVFAVKRMTGQRFETWHECLKLREVRALKKLGVHRNIVNLRQVIRQDKNLFLVFDFHPTNLHRVIQNSAGKPLGLERIRGWAFDLFSALAHMHTHGYFHRDLKPENLLIDSTGNLIVCDFGCAREIRSRPPYTSYVSTRWYRAPELVLRQETYNSPVDLWAAGCVLAEMFLLQPLFPGSSSADQLDKIQTLCGVVNHRTSTSHSHSNRTRPTGHSSVGCPSSSAPSKKYSRNNSKLRDMLLGHGIDEHASVLILNLLSPNPHHRPNSKACQNSKFLKHRSLNARRVRNEQETTRDEHSNSENVLDICGECYSADNDPIEKPPTTSRSLSPSESDIPRLQRRSSSNSRLDQLAMEAEELLAPSPNKRRLSFEWDVGEEMSTHSIPSSHNQDSDNGGVRGSLDEMKQIDTEIPSYTMPSNSSQSSKVDSATIDHACNKANVTARYLAELDDEDDSEEEEFLFKTKQRTNSKTNLDIKHHAIEKLNEHSQESSGCKISDVDGEFLDEDIPTISETVSDKSTALLERWGEARHTTKNLAPFRTASHSEVIVAKRLSSFRSEGRKHSSVDDIGLEDLDNKLDAMLDDSLPPKVPMVSTHIQGQCKAVQQSVVQVVRAIAAERDIEAEHSVVPTKLARDAEAIPMDQLTETKQLTSLEQVNVTSTLTSLQQVESANGSTVLQQVEAANGSAVLRQADVTNGSAVLRQADVINGSTVSRQEYETNDLTSFNQIEAAKASASLNHLETAKTAALSTHLEVQNLESKQSSLSLQYQPNSKNTTILHSNHGHSKASLPCAPQYDASCKLGDTTVRVSVATQEEGKLCSRIPPPASPPPEKYSGARKASIPIAMGERGVWQHAPIGSRRRSISTTSESVKLAECQQRIKHLECLLQSRDVEVAKLKLQIEKLTKE